MTARFRTISRLMMVLTAGIIALIPFHAFLSVYAASLLGHYTAVRLWKEALLAVMACLGIYLLAHDASLRARLRSSWLAWTALTYLLVVIIGGFIGLVVGQSTAKAAAYGILLDGRFVVFMAVSFIASQYHDYVHQQWQKLILISAVIVVGFAVLQYTVLPADFLHHFGYNAQTIMPTETVDQKAAYQRVQSTLRGANPLGAYLVIILTGLSALLLRSLQRHQSRRACYLAAALALSGVALAASFSRSGWLGAVISLMCLLYFSVATHYRKRLLLVSLSIGLVVALVGFSLRANDQFQNTFLHTDEHSTASISSNAGHLAASTAALHDVAHEPLGRGTGTAGPSSVYNKHTRRIAENYYLQVGQEIGWLGLASFCLLNLQLAQALYRRRNQTLALLLLASLAGLTVVNLLSHAWADDTLAYLWWGLAGAALSLPVSTDA